MSEGEFGNDRAGGVRARARVWSVEIAGSRAFPCREDQTVLAAMRDAGLNPLAVGCRGGGCGVCRVRVAAGEYRTGPMSADCVSASEIAAGLALACRVTPRADLQLVAAPMDRGAKSLMRAA